MPELERGDMMKCEKCGADLSGDDSYEFAGQTLCEDCYLDIKAAPKACDPWAVFTAKKEAGSNPSLTAVQQQIMTLVKKEGPLTAQKICKALNISEAEFRVNFTTLRHMELARASKQGDTVCYTTFEQ
jgi:predicted transcriptional regulator